MVKGVEGAEGEGMAAPDMRRFSAYFVSTEKHASYVPLQVHVVCNKITCDTGDADIERA